jgi:hypothetical protein
VKCLAIVISCSDPNITVGPTKPNLSRRFDVLVALMCSYFGRCQYAGVPQSIKNENVGSRTAGAPGDVTRPFSGHPRMHTLQYVTSTSNTHRVSASSHSGPLWFVRRLPLDLVDVSRPSWSRHCMSYYSAIQATMAAPWDRFRVISPQTPSGARLLS